MQKNEIKTIAGNLCGITQLEVVPASQSSDSCVYMIAGDKKLFALKHYLQTDHTPEERMDSERAALTLMTRHGIATIPQWIASETPYALMRWIDGFVVKDPKPRDIDDTAVFIGTLHHIAKKIPVSDAPVAADACLSVAGLVEQLQARVGRLMPFAQNNAPLMDFLKNQFLPAFQKRLIAARSTFADFNKELPQEKRTLVAADFGFHNIMRTLKGDLYFIDFEFFGWDDPCRLACDFLLHPATTLSAEMQKAFYAHMKAIYGADIEPRFKAYYPLFGLRWVTLLLEDFIPEHWEREKVAGTKADWERIKAARLAKSQQIIEQSHAFSGY